MKAIDIKKLDVNTYEYPDLPRSFAWRPANEIITTREFSEDGEFEDMKLKKYYEKWIEKINVNEFILVSMKYSKSNYYNIVELSSLE